MCSYEGGCSYTIEANGLASSLLDSESNSIDMCGNPCAIDEAASSPSETVCTLPHISTAWSAEHYDIVVSGMLHDGVWSGTASQSELAKLTDDKNMIDMEDSSSNCYFQIQYKDDHVGVLDEVKFFINDLVDKAPYDGGLVFQGSDNGVDFTDLWTVDA